MTGRLHGALIAGFKKPTALSQRYFIIRAQTYADGAGGTNGWQMSEFHILNNGTRITGGTHRRWNGALDGTNSSANTDDPVENATNLNDNNTGTKYYQFGTPGLGRGVWIDFGAPVLCNQYRWYTASDSTSYPQRNMTGWTLYGSNDNTVWSAISVVTGFSPPNADQALAGTWTFP